MTNKISFRLAAGFGVCVLLMVVLVGYQRFVLQRLEKLHRYTVQRSVQMELATDAAHLGEQIYVVIANAAINRDLAQSEREWQSTKAAARTKLAMVTAAVDSPAERAKADEAQRALTDIIALFEGEMLPQIKQGAPVPGPLSEVDARIDRRIEAIVAAMQSIARTMSADNSRVSEQFRTVLLESIAVGLGISFFVLLAALSVAVLTTRRIVAPLEEITAAAREIERGNYLCELRHTSADETGVLANAFRSMAQRVAGDTVALTKSNEDLVREVDERRAAEEEVRRLNRELEWRVEERTAELVRTNDQLREVIGAQKRSEEELQRSRAELLSLSRHLQDVREAERTGIAREIHDELGQMLTAMKIDLSRLAKRLPEGELSLHEAVATISGHVDVTITTVQRISAELRPGILDDLGLSAALEWQAQEFEKKTGIVCEIENSLDGPGPDRGRATAIFRIVQEALTNVYRHAAATEVFITLEKSAGCLVVSAVDNGKGVDEAKIWNPGSFGFIGMRERARQFGGDAEVSRLPEGGTRVRATIPVELKEGGA